MSRCTGAQLHYTTGQPNGRCLISGPATACVVAQRVPCRDDDDALPQAELSTSPTQALSSLRRKPVDLQSDPEPSTAGGHGSGGCGGLEQSWDTLSYFSRHQRGNIHSPVKPSRGDIDSISEDQSPSKVFSTTTTSAAPASPNNCSIPRNLRASAVGGAELFGDANFTIPELPTGEVLTLHLRSTWGLGHYIGLTGIEVLDNHGELVVLDDVARQLVANPSSINVLPQFRSMHDPRTVDKLVDGVNRTTDDLHMWLAPFTPGAEHTVTMRFNRATTVSCIRLWNYNKSRIHSSRGVKYVDMTLDGRPIFKGEIQQAPGTVAGAPDRCEVIVYTGDEGLLDRIDGYFSERDGQQAEEKAEMDLVRMSMCKMRDRPGTSHGRDKAMPAGATAAADVPTNRALPRGPGKALPQAGIGIIGVGLSARIPALRDTRKERAPPAKCALPPARVGSDGRGDGRALLELAALNGWDSSPHMLGLTGLELVGEDGAVLVAGEHFTIGLELATGMSPALGATATTNLRQSITGGSTEDIVARLVDGQNLTTSPEHMLLLPYDSVSRTVAKVVVQFARGTSPVAMKVWNYNEGVEGSWFGVKRIRVTLNGQVIFPSLLLRKAAGSTAFDYGQRVQLAAAGAAAAPDGPTTPCPPRNISTPNPNGRHGGRAASGARAGDAGAASRNPMLSGGCVVPILPSGFVFKLVILATHGCPYYVGLNGLELYDEDQCVIPMGPDSVAAVPESINVIPSIAARGGDTRTLCKLYDGLNDTYDDDHMWLTPWDANDQVEIFCYFDEPITLAMVKVWNYAKTPSRGAAECVMYLDDVEIFRGPLREAEPMPRHDDDAIAAMTLPDLAQAVIFTNDAELHEREHHRVHTAGEVKLRLYDDNVPVQAKRSSGKPSLVPDAPLPLRPNTQYPGARPMEALPKRPETSAGVRKRLL